MKEPVTTSLPRPGLYLAHHHVVEACRLLAGSGDVGVYLQLLEIAGTLRQLERESMDLMVGEDE